MCSWLYGLCVALNYRHLPHVAAGLFGDACFNSDHAHKTEIGLVKFISLGLCYQKHTFDMQWEYVLGGWWGWVTFWKSGVLRQRGELVSAVFGSSVCVCVCVCVGVSVSVSVRGIEHIYIYCLPFLKIVYRLWYQNLVSCFAIFTPYSSCPLPPSPCPVPTHPTHSLSPPPQLLELGKKSQGNDVSKDAVLEPKIVYTRIE